MIRLKELREERGWSMIDAASFLHKSYTTYVNHEKGYREPNSEDLKAYATAYNVSVDYLIGRSESRVNSSNIAVESPSPALVLTPDEAQLVTDYRDASEEIREEAAGMLHRSAERNRKDASLSISSAG